MPSSFCCICGRHLKNPLSIELGIGPVCRGKDSKQNANKQGELDFLHTDITFPKHEPGKLDKEAEHERTSQDGNIDG